MNKVEFIRDGSFVNGFIIHGAAHEEGYTAKYPGFSATEEPDWQIAQWFTLKHPLTADTQRNNRSGGFEYVTPSITVTALPEGDPYSLRLELRGSAEFNGKIRQEGEAWPHLLAEQALSAELPYLSELDSLIYKAEMRVDYFSGPAEPPNRATDLYGAQVVQFFTIVDLDAHNFIWFGIPLFDCRYTIYPGYIGVDGGKDDASGALIYTCPQEDFNRTPAAENTWLSYEADLLPLIRKAFSTAESKGVSLKEDFSRFKVTSTNIGWEMFSEHDGAFEIRKMALTGYTE